MKYKFLICLLMCVISSQAQVLDSLGCSGIVGDLKFSLLELPDFQKENGPCWTLMDGKDVTSSKLGAYGYSTIPDPRGLFLRVNDNRQTDRVDTERNYLSKIGSIQEDQIKAHDHRIESLVNYGPGSRKALHQFVGVASDYTTVTDVAGGSESRPINMNFHLYVRIN